MYDSQAYKNLRRGSRGLSIKANCKLRRQLGRIGSQVNLGRRPQVIRFGELLSSVWPPFCSNVPTWNIRTTQKSTGGWYCDNSRRALLQNAPEAH